MSDISARKFRCRDFWREAIARQVAREILMTFPADSENAVCDLAAGPLGMTPATVRRYLRRETAKPDFSIVFLCRAFRGADMAGVVVETMGGAA